MIMIDSCGTAHSFRRLDESRLRKTATLFHYFCLLKNNFSIVSLVLLVLFVVVYIMSLLFKLQSVVYIKVVDSQPHNFKNKGCYFTRYGRNIHIFHQSYIFVLLN